MAATTKKTKKTYSLRAQVRKLVKVNEKEVEYEFSGREFKRAPNRSDIYGN